MIAHIEGVGGCTTIHRFRKGFEKTGSCYPKLTTSFLRHSPIGIEARQGFAHIKSVRVEGDGALGKGQSKVDPLIWTRQPLCIEQCRSVFVWCHVAEAFLVSAVAVVVYVVGDGGFNFLVAGVFVECCFLFHFAEEGFAGCVVPAVAFS